MYPEKAINVHVRSVLCTQKMSSIVHLQPVKKYHDFGMYQGNKKQQDTERFILYRVLKTSKQLGILGFNFANKKQALQELKAISLDLQGLLVITL